jgi:cerevisin
MRFFSFAILAAIIAPVLGTPVSLIAVETAAERKEGSYIVTLHPTASKEAHLASFATNFGARGTVNVTHADWDSSFFHGFAAQLSKDALNALRAHPDVASISEDGIARIFTTQVGTHLCCLRDFKYNHYPIDQRTLGSAAHQSEGQAHQH